MKTTNYFQLALLLLLTLAISLNASAQSYSGGAGTELDPYQIANKADLQYLSENSSQWGNHFLQTADIVFSATDFTSGGDFYNANQGFIPIGNNSTAFTGSYKGQSFKIKNLQINRTTIDVVGFFGRTSGATLANIALENVAIAGRDFVGGLVGNLYNGSTINNCYASGTVQATGDNAGGLVGKSENYSTISNSYATVAVSGLGYVGGLVGWSANTTISSAYATGEVNGSSDYIGGLIGSIESDSSVSNSYATGKVNGANNVGGLVGKNFFCAISKCYATGKVTGASSVGGLVGGFGASPKVTESFWDTQTSSQTSSVGGTGKTTAEMQTQSTFTNWDFTTDWKISANAYPILSYQADNQVILPTISSYTPALITRMLSTATISAVPSAGTVQWFTTETGGTAIVTGGDYVLSGNSLQVANINTSTLFYAEALDGDNHSDSRTAVGITVVYADGDGSEGNPYQVETKNDLKFISENTSQWNYKHFKQIADIVFNTADFETGGSFYNNGKGFSPIGILNISFRGSYNGQNFKISKLKINWPTTNGVGLFGVTDYASLSNIVLEDVDITGNNQVGGIVGLSRAVSITNSFTSGQVNGSSNVGGLVGEGEGDLININNSYSSCAVAGSDNVGGLVGMISNKYNSTISNAYAVGMVSGSSYSGGLVGRLGVSNIIFTNSFWDTETTGKATSAGGGTGKTTADMRTQSTFTAWDFSNVWKMGQCTNNGYPVFQGQSITAYPTITAIPAFVIRSSPATVSATPSAGTIQWFTTETGGTALVSGGDYTVNGTNLSISNLTANTIFYAEVSDGGCTNPVRTAVTATVAYAGGTGTAQDPYQIANKTDLKYLSENISQWSKHFIQTAEIVFDASDFAIGGAFYNNGEGFIPIGNGSGEHTAFYGSYNGQNFKIKNLKINRPDYDTGQHIGLFGSAEGATLANIAMENVDITGSMTVGGLAGSLYFSTLSNSYATGVVQATNGSVGGLVGYNSDGTISNSYATGAVNGSYDVGGLVGSSDYGTISYAYAIGEVNGSSNYIGGLIGNVMYGSVANSYATGKVNGANNVGGLLGSNNGGTISRCYATGKVTGASFVGGLVGESMGGTATNSFWDTETTGKATSAGGGTGKTTADMRTQSTFTAWDFSTVWKMGQCTNNGYPVFQGQSITAYPTITATTPASRCEQGAITLTATPSAGTIQWFTTETGGTALADGADYAVSGNDLTINNLTATTSFYAEVSDGGCINPVRTAVVATINQGTHNAQTETAFESYTWHATLYTTSGTYTYNYNNDNGCASTDTLHLTIRHYTPDVNGIIYVKENGAGIKDGSSWTDALDNLQTAINTTGVQQVWVTAGSYQPDAGQYFAMKEGVKIYGGFEGNESDLSARNWTTNSTILQGNNNSVIRNNNNGLTANAVLDGFTITGGNTNDGGGGINNSSVSPSFSNLIITNNTANGYDGGGGVINFNSTPTFSHVIISNNTATGNFGGGISNIGSVPILTNVTISNNTANTEGGGMYNDLNSSPTIINTTITNNNASYGGGMYNGGYENLKSSPLLYNTIIVGNSSGISGDIDTSSSNNLIQTGDSTSGADFDGVAANNTKPTDIFKDFTNGDYTLKDGSYVVNKGDNSKFAGLDGNTKDLAGNPRLFQGTIDLGAYENQLMIIYVKAGGAGTKDGNSWDNALDSLQTAINTTGVAQVWVAQGTYQPASGQSFAMVENVKIYGGFSGGETQFSARNWKTNSTILQGNGNVVIYNNNNGLTNNTVLDGFTVSGGSANDGAGIRNNNASPVFRNLIISGNTATNRAGGVNNENGSNAIFDNVSIKNNSSAHGGGMVNDASSPQITNSSISNNTTIYNGGGLYNVNGSNPTLINVIINSNSSTDTQYGGSGAGVFNYNSSSPTLINVTIVKNTTAAGAGGGIYNDNGACLAILYNTIISGNNNGVTGSAISGTSANNLIQTANASSGANFDGVTANNTTPTDIFKDFANGNYTLKDGSYAVNKGDNSKFVGLDENTKDLAGNTRLYQGKIDLGAYENQFMIIYIKAGGAGTKDGSSWTDALDNLQTAINTTDVQQVWVAQGTYQAASGQYFSMKENVKIYGGFAGGETQLSARNWKTNVTTLQGNGNVVIYNNNNGLTNNTVLDGFTVSGGSANDGAGIRNNNVSPIFRNLIISGNTATNRAGGVNNENGSNAIFDNVSIKNNSSAHGGGMVNDASSPQITNSSISNNTAIYNGAGMYNIANSNPTLINVLISSNNSTDTGQYGTLGAGVFNYENSSPTFINVTITKNTSNVNSGGAISNELGSSPILYNTIISGNKSGIISNPISASSSNNLIQTGDASSGANFDGATANNSLPSDIFKDFTNGDYTLKDGSYVVNKGDNSKYSGSINTDLDLAGNPRLFQDVIDLGAYENQSIKYEIIYVKQGGTGIKDGKSWDTAYDNLQTAINAANINQLWVAQGTYQPAGGEAFAMKENVKIYGGFVGTETQLSERNFATNVTILRGNGNSVIRNENNGLTNNAVLDGFTVTGGNVRYYGGGIYNNYASPTLSNLIITGNRNLDRGGGIYNNYASPTIINTIIADNYAGVYGGGIYNGHYSYCNLTNVTIANNTAVYGGNGYYAYAYIDNASTWNNCILWDNIGGANNITSNNTIIKGGNGTGGSQGNMNVSALSENDIFKNFASKDYSLKDGSIAVNAGNNLKFAGLDGNTKDLAGNPRLFQGKIDLGAYENQTLKTGPDANNILFVKKDETGGGSSWTDALGEVKDALAWADAHKAEFIGNPLQIWVAAGTYQPNAEQYFTMVENVKIYGGFVGEETQLSDRNWKTNSTTLQGNENAVIINYQNGLTANAVLDGFTVTGGNATYGGGVYNRNASPSLINITFTNNTAVWGGGICNYSSSPILTNVTFANNTAGVGGGIYNYSSSPTLTNVSITNNTDVGMHNYYYSSPTLTNVSITNNTDAGIYNNHYSSPILYNTIISGNNFGISGNINASSSHNLIQIGDNTSGGTADGTGTAIANTTPNDIFKNFSGGDYTLKDGSYAVNKGENSKFMGLDENTKDLAGNPRLYQGKIDLGAYENQVMKYTPDVNGIIYVKESGAGTKDGNSWTDAATDLQLAINTTDVQQIWVAQGTYQPASGQSFAMKEGVKIYGGFVGEETQLSARNWTTNVTTLQGNGNSVIRNNNNSLTNIAVLDGFTITGGNNSSSDGGGIYNDRVSPTFANLVIDNNTAFNSGGGMYNNASSTILTNVTISNNTAQYSGGGMYNFENSSPILTNVTISNNTSQSDGGGIFNADSSPILTNVTIHGNTADGAGGMSNNFSSPVLTNVIISGNTANYAGGGMANENNSSPVLTNVTMSGNTANTSGGGMYNSYSSPILYNTIILGNNSGISGDISNSSSNNLIQTGDNTSGAAFDGITVNNTTPDDIFEYFSSGIYSLRNSSYPVNKGNNTFYETATGRPLSEVEMDLAGNPRLYQGIIDLGAYESQFNIITEINDASDYFKVLSNPTMDIYKLISSKIIEIVELRDLNGKLIYNAIVNETETMLDLRTLNTGVYIVTVKLGKKIKVVKVLKR